MESQEDQQQPREGNKVALVGFAESWKDAPFSDPAVEIWGINELWKYVPRWNRWFEIHDDETLGVTKRDLSEGEQKRHLEWLSKQPADKPIYMQPQFVRSGKFPGAVEYPLAQMIEMFGRYFTSSIGYMLALAIAEGYTWIGLYGIDLASDVEYQQQRPNTEYLIGLARGKGITIEIAKASALLKAGHLYGFEKSFGERAGVAAATRAHTQQLQKKFDEAQATMNTLEGAIQANQNTLKLLEYLERGVSLPAVVA